MIDRWLSGHAGDMGGRAVLLIYKDGKVIYHRAINEMSRRQKAVSRMVSRRQPNGPADGDITATTRLPVASCSKWLSAALVMTFVDEGRLRLSDTVGQWLPALSRSGKGKITISHCLSHLTGLQTPPLSENIGEMRQTATMDEAIEKIADLPVEGAPGSVFRYGNTGLQIAGAVLEKISGKSFEALFAERVARPLQMKQTDFGKAKVALPAGGAYSTAADYLNFLTMILNKGVFNGQRLLSQKSIAAMQVNRVTKDVKVAYAPAEAGSFGYGFGEWVMETPPGGEAAKSVSSPGLFGSFPWVDNENQYGAILLTYNLRSRGRHALYQDLRAVVDAALK